MQATNLPQEQPPLRSPDEQHAPGESQTAYPLVKRDKSFLVPTCAGVDMDMGLLVLGREDVRVAHGEAMARAGAFLEGGLDRERGAQGLCVYADLL